MMTKKEYEEFMAILIRQQEEVKRSKKAARKLLTELGIIHLLVPKEANKKKAKPSLSAR